jgi:hypothetical protein
MTKKYIERGGSLTLTCKHNVEQEKLYKVTWLKSNSKIFEYINGRQPPYRNFSVPGADIDVSTTTTPTMTLRVMRCHLVMEFLSLQFQKSNQHEVTIKINDFDASGMYSCEVSLESPIFTKASIEEQVHVFREYTANIDRHFIDDPLFL